jgi:FkbM family methyltransferase
MFEHLVRDYSQSGEQAHILEAVRELPLGRFLDIGAGDGETFSNTRALALAGWGGLLVEPAAWAFDKLVTLYAEHDAESPHHITLVNALIGPGGYRGLRQWHYSKDDHLSTADDGEAAKWSQVPFVATIVAEVPLHELLDSYAGVGLTTVVSIDTEGWTGDLLLAYQEHRAWEDVQVICYEHVGKGRASRLTLAPPWELVASTPNNLIYRRR